MYSITVSNSVQQDLKANNLSLNEAINVAQNRPLGADIYV